MSLLTNSKYVMQYGNSSTQGLRDGWLFHTCILEPDVFEKEICNGCTI